MCEKIRILFISSFSSLKGGGQRSLYLLIKYLDKNRFIPFLIVPQPGELSEEVSKLGVKVFFVNFWRIRTLNVFFIVLSFVKLIKIIRQEKIDLIHTDSPRQTLYGGIVGKLFSIPVIIHLRVADNLLWLDKILYVLTDSMIAVSEAVKRRFKSIDRRNKIYVVYNGVELDVFVPLERERDDILKIGYFGRIEERKGVEIIIDAVKEVNNERVELVIQGDGDRKYMQRLRDKASDINVVFRNYKKDIGDDIQGVDVVVLPSLYGEGMPRIIIETMALGKVVIASDIPSNREALGKDLEEFLFKPKDKIGLISLLRKILYNREILEEKKHLLRRRAEELFDIRINTKKIETIYTKIIKNRDAKKRYMLSQEWNPQKETYSQEEMNERIRKTIFSRHFYHVIKLIQRLHIPYEKLKIAEVGCGTGTFSLILGLLGAEVTLIDFNERMLKIAAQIFHSYHCKVRCIKADCLGSPPPELNNYFDIAVSGGLVEHFSGNYRMKCIDFHRQIVRSGGFCSISVPNKWSVFYWIIRLFRQLTRTWRISLEVPFSGNELRRIADSLGFKEYWIRGNFSLLEDFRIYVRGLVSAVVDIFPLSLQEKLRRWRKEKLLNSSIESNKDIVNFCHKSVRKIETSVVQDNFLIDNFSAVIILFAFK